MVEHAPWVRRAQSDLSIIACTRQQSTCLRRHAHRHMHLGTSVIVLCNVAIIELELSILVHTYISLRNLDLASTARLNLSAEQDHATLKLLSNLVIELCLSVFGHSALRIYSRFCERSQQPERTTCGHASNLMQDVLAYRFLLRLATLCQHYRIAIGPI